MSTQAAVLIHGLKEILTAIAALRCEADAVRPPQVRATAPQNGCTLVPISNPIPNLIENTL